jgi:hypothetical protein
LQREAECSVQKQRGPIHGDGQHPAQFRLE